MGERNRLILALVGTTWERDQETLVTIYKKLTGAINDYAFPIRALFLLDRHCTRLQAIQNAELSIASAQDHFLDETSMLSVRQPYEFLTRQFLLTWHNAECLVTVLTRRELQPLISAEVGLTAYLEAIHLNERNLPNETRTTLS